MIGQYIRSIKKLKLIVDGSSIYINHNGYRNNNQLLIKDINKHPSWHAKSKEKKENNYKLINYKYRKKFGL